MTESPLMERLKELAKRKCWADELNPCDDGSIVVDDFAGGNVDDAYSGGYESGEILLARDVLDDLGISYK